MRPRGEVRVAVLNAVRQLVVSTGPVNFRQAAAAAEVAAAAAQMALWNMVRDGELRVAGREKAAHSQRWHALYEPVDDDDVRQTGSGIQRLAEVMQTFAATRD
jgi:hypothetical protein